VLCPSRIAPDRTDREQRNQTSIAHARAESGGDSILYFFDESFDRLHALLCRGGALL